MMVGTIQGRTMSLKCLKLLFLLDTICVLNQPTFTKLADQFLKCSMSTPPNIDFKNLTVANTAEIPYYSMLFSHSIRQYTEVLELL